MRVLITSKTLKLTKALRDFASQQITKLVKLHQKITKTQVFLDQIIRGSKRDHNALVKYVVSLPGKTLVIKHKAHDMYEAIVGATDKVSRQIRKNKEKLIHRNRQEIDND